MDQLDSEIAREDDTPLRPHERKEVRVLIRRMYKGRQLRNLVSRSTAWIFAAIAASWSLAQLINAWGVR